MSKTLCAIGIDLGGTKIEVARVSLTGEVRQRIRLATDVKAGAETIKDQIAGAVNELKKEESDCLLVGAGVGVAGQIDRQTGSVEFAPNLKWHHVPLQQQLSHSLKMPVTVTNDVRAATWGEWIYGAGKGSQDLICLFIGTGIGSGIVSGGKMLSGCTNTAGEVGHMTIDLNGPPCTCGNQGCLESLAGGWAIGKRAKELVKIEPEKAQVLLKLVDGQLEAITTKMVVQAYREGDKLCYMLLQEAEKALIAGVASLVNGFNPCRLILGGGLMEGIPELVEKIDQGIRQKALKAATKHLEIVPALLGRDSGVVGAAGLAIHLFTKKEGVA